MTTPSSIPDVTSDDKILSALGYPIFIVAIIMLLMEDKKNRPFIRFHAFQAIAVNIVLWIVYFIISAVTIGFGALCFPIFWLVLLYPAYVAYQGRYLELPVITNFLKNQGWVK